MTLHFNGCTGKCVRLSRLLAFECTLNHCTFISFHFHSSDILQLELELLIIIRIRLDIHFYYKINHVLCIVVVYCFDE